MIDKRVVLVDGVAGYWGRRVAEQLLMQPGLHVIGLDAEPPEEDIKDLDFIQADIRNPLLVDLFREERVDTICHLAFESSTRPSESSFDLNVMGAMKVFSAAAEANVRKIVHMSSTMVYGAEPGNSAFLREEHALNGKRSYGYVRDLVEMEGFCNGFRGQATHVLLTVLRFAHIIGTRCDTPLTRFLQEPTAPLLMGFDPMMQLIHEDDVVRALLHAVEHDVPGTFNVAAENSMPLMKVVGLAGKVPLPVLHPLAYLSVQMIGPQLAPIDLNFLRYPCVGDLRKMREELAFTPQYAADEALREFAAQQRLRQYLPEESALAFDEQRLRDTIERRKRARQLVLDAAPTAQPRRRRTRHLKLPEPLEIVADVSLMEEPGDDHEENDHG
jgi:UDP-glucose 4-epimerase